MIAEGRETVMQLFRIRLDDAGVDGVRGNNDDKTFAQQGIYVP
jgi:hypothetical protein